MRTAMQPWLVTALSHPRPGRAQGMGGPEVWRGNHGTWQPAAIQDQGGLRGGGSKAGGRVKRTGGMLNGGRQLFRGFCKGR